MPCFEGVEGLEELRNSIRAMMDTVQHLAKHLCTDQYEHALPIDIYIYIYVYTYI